MRTALPTLALLVALLPPAAAAIDRHPTGVNVNAQGATSVFITFGGLVDQIPVEATWCGELIPAAPDLGFKCDPTTVFGRLPLRFDRSRLGTGGAVFTDVMSIPPSVARRAYQAAAAGEDSAFFYVRRFASTAGGPDEYVFVTCRLTGGGARVPLALLDVRLAFTVDQPVLAVRRGGVPPPLGAEITYNGTGRLQGRWEVVMPDDDPPTSRDLLTEATLPREERRLQRRYTLLERFNVFLPPTGRFSLSGPDPSRLPTAVDGLYQILLRVEASADREAESNLAAAGAGEGIVDAGAVAGFPLPVLRYFVGSASDAPSLGAGFALLAPSEETVAAAGRPLDFSWGRARDAALYRLEIADQEIADAADEVAFSAVVQQGIGQYRAPSFLAERLGAGELRWRVVAVGPDGSEEATAWRRLRLAAESATTATSDAAGSADPSSEPAAERGGRQP